MIRYLIPFLVTTLWASLAMAETGYEVTSKDGDKVVRYTWSDLVVVSGSKSHTGFDPISKKFIYLSWPRGEAAPKPVASYWDPHVGPQGRPLPVSRYQNRHFQSSPPSMQ